MATWVVRLKPGAWLAMAAGTRLDGQTTQPVGPGAVAASVCQPQAIPAQWCATMLQLHQVVDSPRHAVLRVQSLVYWL